MPLIPHYRADGPASPKAPAMERGRGPRVDASQALQGVARLAGAVTDGAVDLPGVNPNLGQGGAQGLQAMGAGVKDIGDALFDIQERVAEAKARSDIFEAQIALDREAAEFERWRISEGNADPTQWEPELRNRLTTFAGQYTQGKNLSPVALQSIDLQSRSYIERRAIATLGEADKEIVGRAAGALKAQYIRARDGMDYEGSARFADEGFQAGYWGEDTAEMMKLQAQDDIEQRSLSDLKNWVEADINEGRYTTARERVNSSPFIPEPEKVAWLSGIGKQEKQSGFVEEVNQVGYRDPAEGIRMLNEVDENGEWKNWRGLSEEVRFKKGREFSAYQADGWREGADVLSSRIAREGLTEAEIMEDENFKKLPPYLQDATIARSRKGALDDFMELSDFTTKARALDTRSEEGKIKATELLAEASLRFSGDSLESARGAIQNALDNPKPLMPDAEAITMARAGIRERFENQEFGRFKFAKSEIQEKTLADGTKGYFVADPNPPQGFGYKERTKYIWGTSSLGDETMRRIMLSPEEVKQLKDAKTKPDATFTDQVFYQAAGRKFIDAVEEVERNKEQGKYDSATSYGDELGRIMGVSKLESFERRERSAEVIRPDGISIPTDPSKAENSLLDTEAASEFIKNYQIPF